MRNPTVRNKTNRIVRKHIEYSRPDVYAIFYRKSGIIYYNVQNDYEKKLYLFINN